MIAGGYVSDAKELLVRLGGTIEHQVVPGWIYGERFVVHLEGKTETFENEYRMALWVINDVAPEYI